MENKLNKIDELVDVAKKLINEQREMNESNRAILSEIDYLYKRLNENNDVDVYLNRQLIGRCICDEEY